MKDKDFVNNIISDILDENLNFYKQNLEKFKLDIDIMYDSEWRDMTELYSSLDSQNQRKIISFFKTIISDTISSMLGIIDGVSYFKGQDDDFQLIYKGQKLNDYLQDLFLEKLEDNP